MVSRLALCIIEIDSFTESKEVQQRLLFLFVLVLPHLHYHQHHHTRDRRRWYCSWVFFLLKIDLRSYESKKVRMEATGMAPNDDYDDDESK